jgi:hypothetical protein
MVSCRKIKKATRITLIFIVWLAATIYLLYLLSPDRTDELVVLKNGRKQ